MTAIAGVLIFAMFGAGSTGGLLAFAIVYGTFAGGCKYHALTHAAARNSQLINHFCSLVPRRTNGGDVRKKCR